MDERSLSLHEQSHQVGGGKRKLETPNTPTLKRLRQNIKEYFSLQKIAETNIKKFKTTKSTYKVNIKNVEVRNVQNILETLRIILNAVLQEVTSLSNDNDLVRFSIQTPELDFPIAIPFHRRRNISAELLLSEIERVLQSFQEFVLNEQF